jgi:hypothetical protein
MNQKLDLFAVDDAVIQNNIAKMKRLLDKHDDVMVKSLWPPPWEGFNQIKCYEDPEYEFKFYLNQYNMDSEAAKEGLDNIPYFRVDFGRVAYLQSIAYGCEVIMINGLINTKPRYTEAAQLFDIEKPNNIATAGFYGEIEKRMLEIVRRLGDVYFVPGDTQSPIDVLTEILHTEAAMIAMYDEPEALHHLLKMLTETIRDILKHQKSIVKNMIGAGHDYPIPYGVHLSDDNAAFLSPSTYEEFALPYNSELSNGFGGVTLHCCMKYAQNMKITTETEGFLGLDPQTPFNPIDDILEAITGKGFWRIWDRPKDIGPLEYYKDMIDRTKGRCGLLLDTNGPDRDSALRLAHAVKEYAVKRGR